MANQEKMERDLLSCSICLDLLQEPKTLTCMHRFCQSCLHAHIMASVSRDGSPVRSFSCPLCRITIPAPSYSTPPSSWAAQFKTDFYVKHLIELVQSRKELKYPACSKHPNKERGFYCMDCRQTSCETCAILSHRACNQMVTVEDAAKDRRTAIRSQISQISTQISQAVQLESLRVDYMKRMEEQKEQTALKIRETADKLHEVVSSQERKLLKHLENNYNGLQENVSLKVSSFEETVNNARHAVKNASPTMFVSDFELVSDNSCCNTLASCDITNATDEHSRFCQKLCDVKCLYKEDSVPDITLGKCDIVYNLSDDDISVDSKYEVNSGVSSGKLAASTVLPRNPIITPDVTALQENKVIRTIKTRSWFDNQMPRLTGLIVVVPTDTVLATDWANKCVKAFHSKRWHRDTRLALDSSPWGITQLSKMSAAVSIPLRQQICLIKVTPVLDIKKYIKVSKPYHGLASFMSQDSVIIVAASRQNFDGAVTSVDFLTTSGQMLKSFTKDSSGLPLFSDPAYLCVTRDKMVVVSDWGTKTVKFLTIDGELKFTYPPEEAECLHSPQGVTCDPSGGIIVVENGDLLSLTCDGQLEKTLVSSIGLTGRVATDKGGYMYGVDSYDDIKLFRCVGL